MAAKAMLPTEFVAVRKRRRILKALAELIDEKGYRATKIADIVRRAGVARKTFYDNYGGKDDAVRAMVVQTLPGLSERVDPASIERTGLSLIAVELAAAAGTDEGQGAAARATAVRDVLLDLPGCLACPVEPASELLCTLPPGRHGLPRQFVHSNQRARLINAFAGAVVERGYLPLRVEDVTKLARVSRRTFYQHFETKESLAQALAATASAKAAALLNRLDPNSGLAAFVIEVVAAGVSEGIHPATAKAVEVERALQPLIGTELARAAA